MVVFSFIYQLHLAPKAHAFPRGEGAPKGRMRDGVHQKSGIGLQQNHNCQITARIPLQSPPLGGASFPPGEALGLPHQKNF